MAIPEAYPLERIACAKPAITFGIVRRRAISRVRRKLNACPSRTLISSVYGRTDDGISTRIKVDRCAEPIRRATRQRVFVSVPFPSPEIPLIVCDIGRPVQSRYRPRYRAPDQGRICQERPEGKRVHGGGSSYTLLSHADLLFVWNLLNRGDANLIRRSSLPSEVCRGTLNFIDIRGLYICCRSTFCPRRC